MNLSLDPITPMSNGGAKLPTKRCLTKVHVTFLVVVLYLCIVPNTSVFSAVGSKEIINIAKLIPSTLSDPFLSFRGVHLYENYAYITARELGTLLVFNLDEIVNAEKNIGEVDLINFLELGTGYSESVAVTLARKGNYLYVGGREEISIVDITDRENPKLIGGIPFRADHSIKVVNNYLISTGGVNRNHVFDISTPTKPVHMSTFGEGRDFSDATIFGKYLYAAQWINSRGIGVYEMISPTSIQHLTSISLPESIYHVEVRNGYLFAAGEDGPRTTHANLYSYDLTNPRKPTLADNLRIDGGSARAFGISTELSVIGGGGLGSSSAKVIDVENPRTLKVVQDMKDQPGTADGFPFDVAIQDKLILSGGNFYVLASQIRNNVGTNNVKNHDFNGDDKADILWRNSSNGVVTIWLMDGATIASSGSLGGVSAAWQIVGLGDVNADGKADVIWRNGTSGTMAVWLMDGLRITSVGFPGRTSTDWEIEQIGDVDGNGTADLVWRNTNNGVVAVWLMNGATIASSGFLGGVPAAWKIVGLGDLNADGKAEVIWRNSTGVVAVWVMNGFAITTVGFPGSASLDWQIAGVGDVDANGIADVVWRNTNSGAVAVWLMNDTKMVSSGFLAGKGLEWEIGQVEDVDGDGKADVIWFNTNTGEVEIWLMNGVTIASTGAPGAVSTEWEIQ